MGEDDGKEENLVMTQAAIAWSCVGVNRDEVHLCGEDGRSCDQDRSVNPKVPLEQVRDSDGQLFIWEDVKDYSFFKLSHHLGACKPDSPEDLRACSYWSAFHALALRADILGAIPENRNLNLPNRLFGSIVRIVAGGALFCGGCTVHFRMFFAPLLGQLAPDMLNSFDMN